MQLVIGGSPEQMSCNYSNIPWIVGLLDDQKGRGAAECNNLITGEPIIKPELAAFGYYYHSPNN